MSSVPEGRPIVRGEHVYLRAPERADIPTFVRWFNDAEVLRDLAMFAPMSEAAEASWFDRMLAAQGKTDYHFVICLLADDRPIGTIGLHGIVHEWQRRVRDRHRREGGVGQGLRHRCAARHL
jgi:RimJ/RimL family protein N-acetyltransferase